MDAVAIERYLPMGLAGVIFLGCILPFTGTSIDSVSLFTLPASYRELGRLIGAGAIPLLAYAIYVIPLMAIIILLNGLAGAVAKRRQLVFGVASTLLCLLLPGFVGWAILSSARSEIARAGRDLGKHIGGSPFEHMATELAKHIDWSANFTFDLGIGAWLIVIASVGLILSGLGKIKIA